jgi:predicted nucleotidyltransferase
MGDLERILEALDQSGTRYLVVGGVAVVLHGYPRFTADLDLVLALDSPNVLLALQALRSLGYKPRAPVPVEQFADEEIRKSWIEEKGLVVFSLWSPQLPVTEVDLFVKEPFPFDEAYSRALRVDLGFATVTVASIKDIINLKRRAGRAKDFEDIEALEHLEDETTDNE